MKKMMRTLALLPALALSALAQDVSWSDFALGDRVEVTFLSGATIGGTLVASSPKTTSLDYTRESALMLDVTWEYPGLNGTMTVPKKEIKSVRKLRVLDKKTIERLEAVKQQIARDNEKPVEPKPVTSVPVPVVTPEAPLDPKAKEAADRKKKELEELHKKGSEFYAKYPSPYWGPERHTMNTQKRIRGQAWTAAESDFEAGYSELWELGRAASVPKKD